MPEYDIAPMANEPTTIYEHDGKTYGSTLFFYEGGTYYPAPLKLSSGPRVKPEGLRWEHSTLKTSVTPDMLLCAEPYCEGDCGLPALFIRLYYDMSKGLEAEEANCQKVKFFDAVGQYKDYMAHGSWVASGPVWQYRPSWGGIRHYLDVRPVATARDLVTNHWWW